MRCLISNHFLLRTISDINTNIVKYLDNAPKPKISREVKLSESLP